MTDRTWQTLRRLLLVAIILSCTADHAPADWLAVARTETGPVPFHPYKSSDRTEAARGALERCKIADCKIIFLEQNGCFAVGFRVPRMFTQHSAFASASKLQDARQRALGACQERYREQCVVFQFDCADNQVEEEVARQQAEIPPPSPPRPRDMTNWLAVAISKSGFYDSISFETDQSFDRASQGALAKCNSNSQDCYVRYTGLGGCYAIAGIADYARSGTRTYSPIYDGYRPTKELAERVALSICRQNAPAGDSCVVLFSRCIDERPGAAEPLEVQESTTASEPENSRSPIDRLHSEFILHFEQFLTRSKLLNGAAVTVAIFVLLSLVHFVRHGSHSPTVLASNALTSVGVAVIGGSGALLFSFFEPRVTTWVRSLSMPEFVLLSTVFAGAVLLVVPHRLWLALRQGFGLPGMALAASERVRKAAEARAGSYPSPVPISDSANLSSEEIPIAADTGPMMLKIKKSQTRNLWGGVIFMIDARMEISPRERRLVRKYSLGSLLIYSSTGRDKHLDAMKARLESTRGHVPITASAKDQLLGVLRTFFNLFMVGAHASMAAYRLKITVDKLIRGVHVRCRNLNEVLVAKNAIVQAGENLRTYLDVAQSFDGSEEVHEF